jgi:adenylate cyclase class IV
MDLFGRKAKQQAARAIDLAIKLEKQERAAVMALIAMRDRFHKLELELAVTKEQLRLLIAESNKPMVTPPPMLHKTEDEEEVEYALHTGQLDYSEAEKILKQQGFENTAVELAPEFPSNIRY